MAFRKSVLEISVFITLYFVLAQQNTEAARRDPSDLLSLLTNKLHQHKQPLIIVVGKEAPLKKERVRVDKALSSDTSGEAVHLIHHLLGHDQAKKKVLSFKKRTTKPYHRDETKRHRYRAMRLKEEDVVLQKEDKNALRSPIVKKLLRISNSLRCNAKDECQDKCNNKFRGVKGKKCQIQCEIKYVCEEEEEEKDECGEDGNDSCNKSEEHNRSTRGVKLSTEETECKRC